jgi:hypothetical protein
VITEARYLVASEYNDVETWPGVVYRLRFRVPRGVFAVTYEGSARPEQELAGFNNRTEARLAGSDPETPPEIGCGEDP